jgi:hypothetical protein
VGSVGFRRKNPHLQESGEHAFCLPAEPGFEPERIPASSSAHWRTLVTPAAIVIDRASMGLSVAHRATSLQEIL